MKHTPAPWKHVLGQDTHKVARDIRGRMLGPVTMDMDDYDHAIDCVNSHDALVARIAELEAALRDMVEVFDLYARKVADVPFTRLAPVQKARAALAKGRT